MILIINQHPFSIIFLLTYFSLSTSQFFICAEPNISIGNISRWFERVNKNILCEPINYLINVSFMITAIFMIRKISQDHKDNHDPNQCPRVRHLVCTLSTWYFFKFFWTEKEENEL